MRFYLIDKIDEIKFGDYIVGTKCISLSEDIFNEHFPGYPIFPGSLVLEGLAQLSGSLFELTMKDEGKKPLRSILSIVNRLKFRRPLEPGDKATMKATIKNMRSDSGVVSVEAWVNEEKCADGELTFIFMDIVNEELERDRISFYKGCLKSTKIVR